MSKSMRLHFIDVVELNVAMMVIEMNFDKEFYVDESFDRKYIYIAGDEEKLKALIDRLDEFGVEFYGGRIA